MRIKPIILGAMTFLLSQSSYSKEAMTEARLLELYKQSQSEAYFSKQATEADLGSLIKQFNSKFDPVLIGTLGAVNTNQNPIPYTSQAERTYSTSIGIKKNFAYGASATATYAYRKMEIGKYQDPTIPGPGEIHAPTANLNVGISLLKNFLGSLDKAQENEINASKALNTEKNKIQDNAILSQIRTFYWRYGLLEEMKKVKSNLLNAGLKQRSQLKARAERGIADNADLARNQASVAQRKSEIIELEADQLEIIRYVLQLIGDKSASDYKYSFEFDTSSVSQCIDAIAKTSQTPKQWSSYSDFLKSLDIATQSSVTKIKKQHPAEVRLSANIEGYGRDLDSSAAIDQSLYASKANYSIMLDVQIPLGESSKDSQISQIKSQMYGLGKEAFSIKSKMASLHAYSQKNFVQLEETLDALKDARNAMQLSLYEQRKKFNQGRLDYLFLIQEEDSLTQLDAKVASIEFQRKALLIEYFSIFDKTPCTFNLLKSRS